MAQILQQYNKKTAQSSWVWKQLWYWVLYVRIHSWCMTIIC